MSFGRPSLGSESLQAAFASSTTPSTQPTAEQITSNLDLLISLNLYTWPALTLAIQNSWGGSPQVSQDKRDWFCGAISELLAPSSDQIADAEDLEEVLLQVMLDEFEVVVDDDSAIDIAVRIMKGREKVFRGDFAEAAELYRRWREKGGEKVQFKRVEDQEGEDTDWDNDDEEDENDEDDEMTDAPQLVEKNIQRREKVEAEIDEDGFTKVVGRRKR